MGAFQISFLLETFELINPELVSFPFCDFSNPTKAPAKINKIFFDSAVDYSHANSVSDYEIDGVKIRNAICYEATRDELFVDKPKFMIAITNNAWFVPSTQPNLQSKLLKLKAYKYKTTIYHSVNGSPSQMITP